MQGLYGPALTSRFLAPSPPLAAFWNIASLVIYIPTDTIPQDVSYLHLHHVLKGHPTMSKRTKMSGSASRSNFRRGAGTHRRNLMAGNPMRGGIRL